ncbi:MAG: YdbH domain-containing protein [Puniceicoccaceae bacterium]
MESILLGPTEIRLELPATLPESSPSQAAQPEAAPSSLELAHHIDQLLSSLPFDEWIASDIALHLDQPDGSSSIKLDAQAAMRASPQSMTTNASVSSGPDHVSVSASLSRSDHSEHRARVQWNVENPMEWVQRLRDRLPEGFSNSLEAADLEIDALLGILDWSGQDDTLTVQTWMDRFQWGEQLALRGLEWTGAWHPYTSMMEGYLSIPTLQIQGLGDTSTFVEMQGQLAGTEVLHLSANASFSGFTPTLTGTDHALEISAFETTLDFDGTSLALQIPQLHSPQLPLGLLSTQLQLQLPRQGMPTAFRATTSLQPVWQAWHFEGINDADRYPLSLQIEGTHDATQASWDGLRVMARLELKPTRLHGSLSSRKGIPQSFRIQGEGFLQADQTGPQLKLGSSFNLHSFEFRADAAPPLKASGSLQLTGSFPLPQNANAFDRWESIPQAQLQGSVEANGTFAGFPFRMAPLHIETLEGSTETWEFSLSTDWLGSHAQLLIHPQLRGALGINRQLHLHLQSALIHPSLALEASANANLETLEHTFEARIAPTLERNAMFFDLSDYLPHIPSTQITGVIHSTLKGSSTPNSLGLSLQGSLQEASISIPDAKVNINGIELLQIQIDDLLTGVATQGIPVNIQHIDVPPLRMEQFRGAFRIHHGYVFEVESLQFEFCGGQVTVKFEEFIRPPYDEIQLRLEFRNLDLAQLTALIPDFREELHGRLDGFLPVRLKNGEITWGQGEARLTPQTTATLRYAKDGIIAPYIPKIQISKKIDADVNEALRDLTLTELTLQIQPSDRFDEPSTVVLSGHSNHPRIEIPIERIQLNIRAGEVPGLLNRSFNAQRWIQSLLIQSDSSKADP